MEAPLGVAPLSSLLSLVSEGEGELRFSGGGRPRASRVLVI